MPGQTKPIRLLPGPVVATCLAASMAAACAESSGVIPPRDRLFFPTAAAIAPGGDHLVVANSNFDLAYSAGTVVLLDLARVEDELAGCPDEGCEPREESDFIVGEETVAVGSYASFLATAQDGGRMYLTVRGNKSLTWLEMDPEQAPGRKLTCFDPDSPPRIRTCDSAHRIQGGLPSDPYAIGLQRKTYPLVDPEGNPAGESIVDWVFVSSLTSGSVTVFEDLVTGDLDRSLAPKLVHVATSFPQGVSAIEAHPLAAGTFYASTRNSTSLQTFSFASDPLDFDGSTRIVMGATVRLDVLADGHDSRDLAFSSDGNRAYVTNRSPNTLLIVDTSLDSWGWPRNEVVGVVELDAGPSLVTVWQPPGSEREWIYATCYDADRLMVIDPVLRQTVDLVLTGNGPHVFVTDGERLLGYLVNFVESTISVVDLDPGSPTFNDVRATIGLPREIRSHD